MSGDLVTACPDCDGCLTPRSGGDWYCKECRTQYPPEETIERPSRGGPKYANITLADLDELSDDSPEAQG